MENSKWELILCLVIKLSRGFQISLSFVQPKLYEEGKTMSTEDKELFYLKWKWGYRASIPIGPDVEGSIEHNCKSLTTEALFLGLTCPSCCLLWFSLKCKPQKSGLLLCYLLLCYFIDFWSNSLPSPCPLQFSWRLFFSKTKRKIKPPNG